MYYRMLVVILLYNILKNKQNNSIFNEHNGTLSENEKMNLFALRKCNFMCLIS